MAIEYVNICLQRRWQEDMRLFKTAFEGNESELVNKIEVEGTGLWTHLLSREVLTREQITICKNQVQRSLILLLVYMMQLLM